MSRAPNISAVSSFSGNARTIIWYATGFAALCLAMALGVRIGAGGLDISWREIIDWVAGRPIDPGKAKALSLLRVPRALMAMLAGAVFACAGVVYQAILRNPLAGPYTLGVSGGATLGAVLAIAAAGSLGWASRGQTLPLVSSAALAGAVGSTLLIYALAQTTGRFSPSALVLAGVTLNLLYGSMILLLQYLADFTQAYEMIRWMMGGLDVTGYTDYWILGPVSAAGFVIIILGVKDLDLLAVDPVSAATLGVKVGPVRWRLLMAASLMTGCVVAFTGPIGFVGLIVPHGVRLVAGASHRRVIPASIAVGAIFLLACDILAQNILSGEAGEELPIGVITSMLGGPFFVFLLLRRRGAEVWGD